MVGVEYIVIFIDITPCVLYVFFHLVEGELLWKILIPI